MNILMHLKMAHKRYLINNMDMHGVRHNRSRKISLARLLLMGIGC